MYILLLYNIAVATYIFTVVSSYVYWYNNIITVPIHTCTCTVVANVYCYTVMLRTIVVQYHMNVYKLSL